MPNPDEVVELLSRRHDLLRSLHRTPRERHELVDHVGASKSTVYKGVSQLTELGLVESTRDGLRPTLSGTIALRRYDALVEAFELGTLLSALPADAIDPAALVGAEVVTPDGRSVDRHFLRVEEVIEQADTLYGFTPAVASDHLSAFGRRVSEGTLTTEFVLAADIVDHLRRNARATFDGLIDAEGATLWRTEADLPFTLLVAESEDRAEVGVELWNDGVVTGLLVNDTAESLQWAESAFRLCRRGATRIVD